MQDRQLTYRQLHNASLRWQAQQVRHRIYIDYKIDQPQFKYLQNF